MQFKIVLCIFHLQNKKANMQQKGKNKAVKYMNYIIEFRF